MNTIIARYAKIDNNTIKKISDRELIKESYNKYLSDESKLIGDIPEKIYFPTTTEQVSSLLQELHKKNERVTISGGRTGITGGAVPCNGTSVITLEELEKKAYLYYDSNLSKWIMKVSANTTLSEIEKILKNKTYNCDKKVEAKLFYPVDPTEKEATIGGMVSTNASGARTLFYGPTRNWIHSLTVILADGAILELKRGETFFKDKLIEIKKNSKNITIKIEQVKMPKTKHNAGYYLKNSMDIVDLFIGQEGTLGVITEVGIILKEVSEDFLYLTIFLNNDNLALINDIKKSSLNVIAIEYFDYNSIRLLKDYRALMKEASHVPIIPNGTKSALYVEIAFNKNEFNNVYYEINKILKKNKISDESTWAGFSKKTLEEMKAFRHALPERINSLVAYRKQNIKELTKIGTDMAVPDKYLSKIIKFYKKELEKNSLEYYIFGHIGNAHLHVNILPKNIDELKLAKEIYKRFAKKVVKYRGSVSAEHGIGRLKKEFLLIQYNKREINIMKEIKATLDPESILNYGVLF